ncbi:unnamed protein product [Hymenolepis diminuta]|uniref:UBC core domain-containing protein n=1 Tax=Hymenolepis diminuta TaxID=6216 RepID=A0A3P6ZP01_HYMDI|nr:unnamed protein product [Hymenolepis diminuta]
MSVQLMTNYNLKSPAVKRLMREAQELSKPTELYYAQPLEDNLFEWHFTIRGPEGSEFEGGIYHGQISLPTEYPMKPPNIMLLTPNGRFEQYRQICLSISGYHPETWCPSWSIRTALLAIIGFMPTSGAGAIGSMSVPTEERKKLAVSSKNYVCDICGPTKDLLLPLTSASNLTAQEAKVVASQFVLTASSSQNKAKDCDIITSSKRKQDDPNAPKSEAPEAQNSDPPKESNVIIGTPQLMSQPAVTPTSLQSPNPMVNETANLKPAYWLCYPVYAMTRITNGTANTTAAPSTTNNSSANAKKDPPLSFEDWLKQVKFDNDTKSSSAEQCKEFAELPGKSLRHSKKSNNYDQQNRSSSSLSPNRINSTQIRQCNVDKMAHDTYKNNTPPLYLVTDDVTEDFTLSSTELTERTSKLNRPSDFHRNPVQIEAAPIIVPNYMVKSILETSAAKTSQQGSSKHVPGDSKVKVNEHSEGREKIADNSEAPSNNQNDSSSAVTTVLEETDLKEKAPLHPETPQPAEPEAEKASTSEIESSEMESSKDIAHRLLQEAAERHRRRAQRILAQYDDAEGNPNQSMLRRLRLERGLRWMVIAVAMALIALIIRRIMIMSTTGSH